MLKKITDDLYVDFERLAFVTFCELPAHPHPNDCWTEIKIKYHHDESEDLCIYTRHAEELRHMLAEWLEDKRERLSYLVCKPPASKLYDDS